MTTSLSLLVLLLAQTPSSPAVGVAPSIEEINTAGPATEAAPAPTPAPLPAIAPVIGSDVPLVVPPPGMFPVEDPSVSVTTERIEDIPIQRTGLWGWGLGLELPMFGTLTGFGSRTDMSVGFVLGGALSYEVTPTILARLGFTYSQANGGEGDLRYVEGLQERSITQSADWISARVTLGGTYVFRDGSRPWSPYVGADTGVAFSGLVYDIAPEYTFLRTQDRGDVVEQCTDISCQSNINDGLSIGWTVGVRGGARYDLFSWLQGFAELGVQYAPLADETVSNTVSRRDVRTRADDLLLLELSIGARFVL